jgi:general stress protein YciG
MGLPVVGTRHGGIAEAVHDGETGFLAAEAAVEPLSAALDRLVSDRALRLRMGRQARSFVDRHFNLRRQVEQHVTVYEKVVAQAAADPDWRTRAWLPAGYPARAARALLAHGIQHPTEFSIAELLERLVWARRLEQRLVAGGLRDPAAAVDLVGASFVPEAARIAGRSASAPDRAGTARPGSRGGRAGGGVLARARRLLGRAGRRGGAAREGRESRLERLYNLKGAVPQAVKFPLKMMLGRILVRAIEVRSRRHGDADVAEQLDGQVLDFFVRGGDLERWEASRAAAGPGGEATGGTRAAG